MPALTLTIAVQAQAIKAACAKYAVPLQVFMGMYNEETSLGTDVTTSSTGAIGPFQFEPATAGQYGYPLTNTPNEGEFQAQAMAAAHLLSDNYQQFHSWQDALAAYNAGPGNIGAGQGYASAALAFTIPGNWVSALGGASGAPIINNTAPGGGAPISIAWSDDFTADNFASRYRRDPDSAHWTRSAHALSVGEVFTPTGGSPEWGGLLAWIDPTNQLPSDPMPVSATVAVEVSQMGPREAFVTVGFADEDTSFSGRAFLGGGFNITGALDVPQRVMQVSDDTIGFGDPPWSGVNEPATLPATPFAVAFAFDTPDLLSLKLSNADGTQLLTHRLPPELASAFRSRALFPFASLSLSPSPPALGGPIVISDWSYSMFTKRSSGVIVPGGQQGGSVRNIGRVTGGAQQLPAPLVQQAVSLGIITPAQAGKIQPGGQQGGSQRTLISPSGGS